MDKMQADRPVVKIGNGHLTLALTRYFSRQASDPNIAGALPFE